MGEGQGDGCKEVITATPKLSSSVDSVTGGGGGGGGEMRDCTRGMFTGSCCTHALSQDIKDHDTHTV